MFLRILLILVILPTLLSSTDYSQYFYIPPINKVYGGYVQCTVFVYKCKNGKIDNKNKKKNYIQKFDKNGKETDITRFLEDGTSFNRFRNQYYDNGNLKLVMNLKPDGTVSSKRSYKYNRNGKVIEEAG